MIIMLHSSKSKISIWIRNSFILLGLSMFWSPVLKAQYHRKDLSHKDFVYPEKLYQALKWRNIGPYRGGRSSAVAGVASQPETYYFGAEGGGVWKSTDGGVTWLNVSDGYFNTTGIGAITVAPSDPNVVYVGTGETNMRSNITPGDGVYKSTDAGKTWKHIGLNDTQFIGSIVVDPDNPDIVYVAAMGHAWGDNKERGVFRSTDGGKTWSKILYVDEKTGAIDLVMDPNNSRILYAAMWQAYTRSWTVSSGGPGSGIYKSTDGGDHWTNITRDPGLPKGVIGKIGLAVSGANSNRVWALVESKHGGLFRSDNAGKTWSLVGKDPRLMVRNWYFNRIFADPKDQNVVYALVLGVYKSIDGGKTFNRIQTHHGDEHVLWINPNRPDHMIEGDDGGAIVTRNSGKTWTLEDQNTAQFYHVALDNRFPYHLYGPQQDNTSMSILSRTDSYGITSNDWYPVAGGEDAYVVPNPAHPTITYGGSYDGYITRYNEVNHQSQRIDVLAYNKHPGATAAEVKYRFNWTFPMMVSNHDPKILYTGAQYVFKSTDEGMNWTRISPDLTRNEKSKQGPSGGPITKDNNGNYFYNTIFALAESPVKEGVLWAGSDDGLIHVTQDGGKHWENVTPKNFPDRAIVSIIEPSHFDVGTAYVAATRYKLDDFHPYLFKTTDFGKHWENITHDIPDYEFTRVIREDTRKKGLLYVGTERGVWISFNDGKNWQPLQLNLPSVSVRDIQIQDRENDLVIATHGRGFWIMDNLKPLRQLSESVEKTDFHLFKPEHTYMMKGSSGHRPGETFGENPPNGAVFFYTLKSKPKKIKLSLLTMSGDTIRTFSGKKKESEDYYTDSTKQFNDVLSGKIGMNRFVWDLKYPDAVPVPGVFLGDGKHYTYDASLAGPKVIPGTYKAILTVDSKSMEQDFTVIKDPRNPSTQADLQAELDLLMKIHNELNVTDRSINHLMKTRKELNDFLAQLKDYPKIDELKKAARPILDTLSDIQDHLIQTKAKAPEQELNHEYKLHTMLASLAQFIQTSYTRPSHSMYTTYDILSGQVDEQMNRLHEVYSNSIPKFNALVKNLGVPNPVYLSND